MKQIVKDIIPVIFGILIALAVNNWNEDRKDNEYLNQIYSSIKKELEESRTELETSIPKQQILLDSLGKHLNNDAISIFEIIQKADGIQKPFIKNNSWKAIANSKIELIEFKKLSALSEIDASKEDLEFKTNKLIDFLIENLKTTDQEKKEVFMLLSREVLTTTKYTQLEIEEFLKI